MNPLHIKTAAVVSVVAAIPVISQWNSNQLLRHELAQLQYQKAKVIEVVKEVEPTPAFSRMPAPRAVQTPIAPVVQPAATEQADTWHNALHEQDPIRRMQRIGALLAQLTPAQAPSVAAQFEDLAKRGRRFSEEYRLFLRAWGRLDGHAAMAHIAPSGFTRHNSNMLAALAGWASVKPFAAQGWVNSQPEGKSKEELIYGLIDGWSMVDFASAAAYAESRPRSTSRNRFRRLLLERSLASGGVHAAQQWFHRIADNEHNTKYKEMAFSEVIQAMLYRDPSAAAQWISQMGGQKFVTAKPIVQTAAMMAKDSPEQAMHFLQNAEHVDAQILLGGKEQVMSKWAGADPLAAGNYLQDLGGGVEYDKLAGSYAQGIAQVDSEKAIQWAKSIENEALRGKAERNVVATLVRNGTERQALMNRGYSSDFIDEAVKPKPVSFVSMGGGTAGGMASYGFTETETGDARWATRVVGGKNGQSIIFRTQEGQKQVIEQREKAVHFELRAREEGGVTGKQLLLLSGDEKPVNTLTADQEGRLLRFENNGN